AASRSARRGRAACDVHGVRWGDGGMSITSLIPAQYRLIAAGLLLAAVAAAGASVVWWGFVPRIQLEAERAGRAEQSLVDARQMIELQAGVLATQQSQIGAVTE